MLRVDIFFQGVLKTVLKAELLAFRPPSDKTQAKLAAVVVLRQGLQAMAPAQGRGGSKARPSQIRLFWMFGSGSSLKQGFQLVRIADAVGHQENKSGIEGIAFGL